MLFKPKQNAFHLVSIFISSNLHDSYLLLGACQVVAKEGPVAAHLEGQDAVGSWQEGCPTREVAHHGLGATEEGEDSCGCIQVVGRQEMEVGGSEGGSLLKEGALGVVD